MPRLHASWTHGNALTVESPENLNRVGHQGWGADMSVKAGKSSWFHIALPTPVIVDDVRTKLTKVFLLFSGEGGQIREVHVYDGSSKVQEFKQLFLSGEHRLALDGANTFNLATPHTVVWGIGITFSFTASIGFDSQIPPSRLILAAAGGDFVA
ncbi:hypothetical protein W97_09030 [Coniosporium apollinis CBS 100218]|uniref:Uncharacterized protein n=1 Tax=Coniosporium apollinis (strain CBS 100218) TaxID=1168221 RepID=R7Z6G8_CONA1|nr:uncharacterized protein W97_09030 [Coniosporium apollinis CBS 100218]EON69767.1 hypothetical protein W97_09030 [Coniosporium apollinis CBS 100218]